MRALYLSLALAILPVACAKNDEAYVRGAAAEVDRYDGYPHSVADADAIRAFEERIAGELPGKRVIGCRDVRLITRWNANGNFSYGGNCTVEAGGTRETTAYCFDKIVGHWSERPGGIRSKQAMLLFIRDNCTGG